MPLPTGTISASEINVELGRSATAAFDINRTAERVLAGVPSGAISLASFRGKSASFIGTINDFQIKNTDSTYYLLKYNKASLSSIATSNPQVSVLSIGAHITNASIPSAVFGYYDTSGVYPSYINLKIVLTTSAVSGIPAGSTINVHFRYLNTDGQGAHYAADNNINSSPSQSQSVQNSMILAMYQEFVFRYNIDRIARGISINKL